MATAAPAKLAMDVMLWPDGRIELPAAVLDALGIQGGWQCSVEVVDGAIVIRPSVAISDDDLWAYTPEQLAQSRAARAEPVENALRLSPRDLQDVMERRITPEDLRRRVRP